MGVIRDRLFKITGNEKYALVETENGVQPNDPEQNVSQEPEIEVDADADYS